MVSPLYTAVTLSVCAVTPLPLPPPHPAMPATANAKSSRPTQAYPRRLAAGRRFRLNRYTISRAHATIQIGSVRKGGNWCGTPGGVRNDSATVRVDVQKAVAVLVPAVGVHVTAAERLLAPFLNWTVPVGPTPWLVVATVAVRVTLPPEEMLNVELVTVVVVVPPVIARVGGVGFVSGPPPGCGLNVSTFTVCAVARLAAGTWTVRVVEFVTVTAFAGSETVLNCTSVAPVRKLLPFTVRASPLDPAGTVVGEIEVIPGIGLRTVKGTAFVVLPEFVTVICARAPFCS